MQSISKKNNRSRSKYVSLMLIIAQPSRFFCPRRGCSPLLPIPLFLPLSLPPLAIQLSYYCICYLSDLFIRCIRSFIASTPCSLNNPRMCPARAGLRIPPNPTSQQQHNSFMNVLADLSPVPFSRPVRSRFPKPSGFYRTPS